MIPCSKYRKKLWEYIIRISGSKRKKKVFYKKKGREEREREREREREKEKQTQSKDIKESKGNVTFHA